MPAPATTASYPLDFTKSRKHKSLVVRWIFAILGAVFLDLGVTGIFLPMLPTTPFLLLSAACFAQASSRIYHWLLNHPSVVLHSV